MKKVLASFLVLFVLMIGLPLTAEAHAGCYRHRRAKRANYSRSYYRAPTYQRSYRRAPVYYGNEGYGNEGYVSRRPSFYRRHRNLINLGIATGGGALIGGIARGKRGAGYGALIGAGSGALYTYVLNKKKRRY
jgi:hypothetical protein